MRTKADLLARERQLKTLLDALVSTGEGFCPCAYGLSFDQILDCLVDSSTPKPTFDKISEQILREIGLSENQQKQFSGYTPDQKAVIIRILRDSPVTIKTRVTYEIL